MNMTRRGFSKSSLAALLAAQSAPFILHAQDGRKYRTVLIGCGWWGMNILNAAIESGRCDLTALCDVDERMLDKSCASLKQYNIPEPKRYRDFREIISKEKPEIVIVATPDHWHPLITIEACRQGAHVYVEKPVGHTVLEGSAMVAAARKYGRKVQVGTHRRVSPHNLSAYEFVQSGRLGRIGTATCFIAYGGGPEQPKPNIEPPRELDWDLWCGPAPLRHFCGDLKNVWNGGIHPRGFRNYLDFANGQIADWGVHWVDQVLWFTGRTSPVSCYSAGGRPVLGPAVYNDQEQTSDAPDHQVAVWKFEDGFNLTWEHRRFANNNHMKGENVGVLFYGEKGILHLGWQQGWTFFPSNKKDPEVHVDAQLHDPDGQNIKELWADLITSIESEALPVCDILKGHQASAMCLLANLSMKLGRSIRWDGKTERTGDAEADQLLKRDYRGEWQYPV